MFTIPHRVHTAELLDDDHIPTQDLYKNLEELNFINTWLGGHAITLSGLKKLLPTGAPVPIKVADIGCGGGDNLKYLAKWARKKGMNIQFTGIDIKLDCITFARENCKNYPEIDFICADYSHVTENFDITFSALFCHHLKEKSLKMYIEWSLQHSNIGFFINDLQRHYVAYYSIKWLTALFSNSYLVKNDAPLSVKRGFLTQDWEQILTPVLNFTCCIQWKWAFRYLVWTKKAHIKM